MKSVARFGTLSKYRNNDYRDSHMAIMINDGTGEKEYLLIAVCLVDLTSEYYFDYSVIPNDYSEKVAYINQLLNSSVWKADNILDYDYSQKMVLLSTCEYDTQNERLVLIAIEK